MPVIESLAPGFPGDASVTAVRQGLKDAGFVEGQNVPSSSALPGDSSTDCPKHSGEPDLELLGDLCRQVRKPFSFRSFSRVEHFVQGSS
jgi:hypothetical protein